MINRRNVKIEIKKFKFNGNEIYTCDFIEDKIYEGTMVNGGWYFMDKFWLDEGLSIKDLNIIINGVYVSKEDLENSFEEVNYIIGVDLAKGDDYSVTN